MYFDSWHEERFLLKQSTHQNDFGEKLPSLKLILLGQGVKQDEMQDEVLSHGMFGYFIFLLLCPGTHMQTHAQQTHLLVSEKSFVTSMCTNTENFVLASIRHIVGRALVAIRI